MITEQPDRLRLRLLVVLARHGAILPNKEGAHQTQDGSIRAATARGLLPQLGVDLRKSYIGR
jgi:hypothetical protein